MGSKQYYIYIASNKVNTVLYTGVTNDLVRRIYEHKTAKISSFTSKYKISKLLYYECLNNIDDAISREKQIKGGSRKKKIDLIKNLNPKFNDLYEKILK